MLMLMAIVAFAAVACAGQTRTTYEKEAEDVAVQQDQMNKNQPIHSYPYSWERELFQQMFDARMSASTTYNYRIDERDGFSTWSCVGAGLPIPYSTQLSNPEVRVYGYEGGTISLPQPEPNGLYTPDDAAATLIPCYNADGKVSPVYEELPVTSYFTPQCFSEIQRVDGSWTGKWFHEDCGASSFEFDGYDNGESDETNLDGDVDYSNTDSEEVEWDYADEASSD